MWNSCAILEPKAAPVLTAGPCSPAEPPKPTVIGAVINEAKTQLIGSVIYIDNFGNVVTNIRKKEFKNVSISLVSRSIGLSLSQVIIGLIALGPIGLIIGQIISYFTGNWMLYKTLKEAKTNVVISKNNIKKQAIIYKKFPIFSLPSIFINSINLIIGRFFKVFILLELIL